MSLKQTLKKRVFKGYLMSDNIVDTQIDSESITSEEKTLIDEKNKKLIDIGRILFFVSFISIWLITITFSVHATWNGKGFFETPWNILGIITSLILVIVFIVPLFKSIKADIQKIKEEKEREKED